MTEKDLEKTTAMKKAEDSTHDDSTNGARASFVSEIKIGGLSPLILRSPVGVAHDVSKKKSAATFSAPVFTQAILLPGRGMNTFQLKAKLGGLGSEEHDLLFSPNLQEAQSFFGGEDPYGNLSYRYGGAFLIPFANRIRGVLQANHVSFRKIETRIGHRELLLNANHAGKSPTAEAHAMHGLILKTPTTGIELLIDDSGTQAVGHLTADDFGVGWPSKTRLDFAFTLENNRFIIRIDAQNVGQEATPMGIGWHPYFNLPGGDRAQVELKIPASTRVLVDNYDNVFPTGETEAVSGTPYDFRESRALGELFLDDCFLNLNGPVELVDRAAHYGLRIHSRSPAIKALQVYAPVDQNFIAIEPQLNIGDPYGKVWPIGTDNGMVTLQPGEKTYYEVELELFTP